ncbi:MAG: hypothetical protein ABI456_14155 [Ktedonobacteraceae bacterium]
MIGQDHPGTQGPEPGPRPQKLVLPAPGGYRPPPAFGAGQRTPVVPEMLLRQGGRNPNNPIIRLGELWRRDPAYKALIIAVALVLVAGTLFASLAANALLQSSGGLFTQNTAIPTTPQVGVAPAPTGTVDLHPAFPTPGGGKGTKQSSQPPMQGTPALQASPTGIPTQQPGNGNLVVQITGLPPQVPTNSMVPVSVQTSTPGATVQLQVTYNAPPFFYTSTQQVTDGNGNATINWQVNVFVRGKRATARVTVIAFDQNGQQGHSDSIRVQITGAGGG